MYLPIGFILNNNNNNIYILKINKRLYGLKQAANNCYNCLKTSVEDRGVNTSQFDQCVFIKKNIAVLVYFLFL